MNRFRLPRVERPRLKGSPVEGAQALAAQFRFFQV